MEEQNNWSTAKIPLLTLLYPFPSLPFVLFQQYSLKELSCLKILFFYSLLNLFQSSLCHFHFTKITLFKIICVSHIAKFSCLLAVFILLHLSAILSQFITLSIETLFFFSCLTTHQSCVVLFLQCLTVPFLFLSRLPYSPCPLNVKMFQVKILGSFLPSCLNSYPRWFYPLN